MNIPAGRYEAANWVLQCSMGVLMVNLLSVPYNATIISHERMDLFAWISLGEAFLKLAVAMLLVLSPDDKLKLYAVLMLVVSILVRLTYGICCRRLFPETRGRMVFDRKLLKEMTSFAGWNVLGSSAYIVNTQGVNQLVNIFFGVAVNGARLVAMQVENILKQFVSNFLTALNPQITKSYAASNKSYSFELVGKGVKYSGLILLTLGLPLVLEAPELLHLWLKDVPAHSILFTRLTVLCLLVDLMLNPLLTLIQADGRIKGYYLVSSSVALLCFGASWAAFAAGAPAFVSYLFFALAYMLVNVVKIIYARRLAGYTLRALLDDAIIPLTITAVLLSGVLVNLHFIIPGAGWRLLAVLVAEAVLFPPVCWEWALTQGEREFVLRKIGRFLPDGLYLRMRYRVMMNRRLHLCCPRTFNEKIQWLKIHDRRPEYVTLVDKAAVKDWVAGRIGAEYVIPNLGVWSSAKDIDFDSLPERYVLKCNHDSGSVVICDSSTDREAVAGRLEEALKRDFSMVGREWAYKGVVPKVIAEPLLDDGNPDGLTDYKFFCFNGEPRFLYVSRGLDDHRTAHISFVWPDWTPAPFRRSDYEPFEELPPAPSGLGLMMELSRRLAEGIRFVRVDFYQVGDKVLFSEMTFYPCCGFLPLGSYEEDCQMGDMLNLKK
jgi:O-antigen/teichoic acid export membrane protein